MPAPPLPYRYPPAGPFWVSPSGNDSTGDGSQGNPWATIQKARDYIRTNNLNSTQIADLQVNVRAGTYSLATSGPITFGKLDGGFNGHRVIYKSYDGPGQAIISGGVAVTSWTLSSGSTYVATVPKAFWTMYENGNRSTSARLPKRALTPGFPSSFAPYFTCLTNATEPLNQMGYDSGDFNPAAYAVADLQVVVWPYFAGTTQLNWLTDTQQVQSINAGTTTLTFTNQSKFNPTRSRYFIQGVKDNLSDPGEWYLDRSGLNLSYIARDGAIGSQNIVVPQQSELVQFFGVSMQQGDRCENITWDGFAVQYTDFVPFYRNGYAYDFPTTTIQSPVPQPHIIDPTYDYFCSLPQFRTGAIHLKYAKGITINAPHVNNVGMHGIYAEAYVQSCVVSNPLIEKTGLSGIRFDGNYPGEGDYVNNNEVYNFKVLNSGELSGGASGIDVANSGSNLIHYGYMENGPRKAIWMFANFPLTNSLVYTRNNVVDHVYCKNWVQDSGDTGVIAMTALNTLSAGLNTNTVTQCIVDGVAAHPSASASLQPNGLFTDDYSSGQVFTNVQCINFHPGVSTQYRDNSGGAGPVLTNCSFLPNGLPDVSFDPALMDTANIGVTAGFPY
jgi:hypothetical protein